MEITAWAQQHQKSLSVNTVHIHKCRLKLYNVKKWRYVNMIQKSRLPLWTKAHLKQTEAQWESVLWSDYIIFVNPPD